MALVWHQISELAVQQDYQQAYDFALKNADDIYLVRLLL